MPNAINTAYPSMGGGMAAGAAETLALLPEYKMAAADAASMGQDFPDFQTWLAQMQAQNAQKIMQR